MKRILMLACFRVGDFCGTRAYYADRRFGWNWYAQTWFWWNLWWLRRARHLAGLEVQSGD